MACRKKGRLGLDHVYGVTNYWITYFFVPTGCSNKISIDCIDITVMKITLLLYLGIKTVSTISVFFVCLKNKKSSHVSYWWFICINNFSFFKHLIQTQLFTTITTVVTPGISDKWKSLLILFVASILWYDYGVTYFWLAFSSLKIFFSNIMSTVFIAISEKKIFCFVFWSKICFYDIIVYII